MRRHRGGAVSPRRFGFRFETFARLRFPRERIAPKVAPALQVAKFSLLRLMISCILLRPWGDIWHRDGNRRIRSEGPPQKKASHWGHMGWTTHHIVQVRGPAVAVELFRQAFAEFFIPCTEAGTTSVCQYGYSLEQPPIDALVHADSTEGPGAMAEYLKLLNRIKTDSVNEIGSLGVLTLKQLLRILMDPRVSIDVKNRIWNEMVPEIQQKLFSETATSAQIDVLLHDLFITDAFWRKLREEVVEILNSTDIQCYLCYEGNLMKWDLVDELTEHASNFPSIEIDMHSSVEIRYNALLQWREGKPLFSDPYDQMDFDFSLDLYELLLVPSSEFFPATAGWRHFACDVVNSDEHLILAAPRKPTNDEHKFTLEEASERGFPIIRAE